ncbi:PREDICTED: serine/threonine/tyrosine-interacting protein A-like [Acropora digitifera]|uniref:serine/threonine/tyrosine-interacting protein A-like n=1 Tax=Acropora digitifera TaxID=70779 RepID=UPI00077A9A42|nr:PREDICTED: serine/threonine/tyrosine-interacting protein A-like [Acropora digitifera]
MQSATSPECIPALEFPEIPNKDELVDWTYSKRREMQEIVPGVYLGPYSAATNSELHVLKQVGISHVICIRHEREAHYIRANFPEHFIYLVLNVADSTTENIIRHFPKVKAFVDSCLRSGGKVLLHGTAGISRRLVTVS